MARSFIPFKRSNSSAANPLSKPSKISLPLAVTALPPSPQTSLNSKSPETSRLGRPSHPPALPATPSSSKLPVRNDSLPGVPSRVPVPTSRHLAHSSSDFSGPRARSRQSSAPPTLLKKSSITFVQKEDSGVESGVASVEEDGPSPAGKKLNKFRSRRKALAPQFSLVTHPATPTEEEVLNISEPSSLKTATPPPSLASKRSSPEPVDIFTPLPPRVTRSLTRRSSAIYNLHNTSSSSSLLLQAARTRSESCGGEIPRSRRSPSNPLTVTDKMMPLELATGLSGSTSSSSSTRTTSDDFPALKGVAVLDDALIKAIKKAASIDSLLPAPDVPEKSRPLPPVSGMQSIQELIGGKGGKSTKRQSEVGVGWTNREIEETKDNAAAVATPTRRRFNTLPDAPDSNSKLPPTPSSTLNSPRRKARPSQIAVSPAPLTLTPLATPPSTPQKSRLADLSKESSRSRQCSNASVSSTTGGSSNFSERPLPRTPTPLESSGKRQCSHERPAHSSEGLSDVRSETKSADGETGVKTLKLGICGSEGCRELAEIDISSALAARSGSLEGSVAEDPSSDDGFVITLRGNNFRCDDLEVEVKRVLSTLLDGDGDSRSSSLEIRVRPRKSRTRTSSRQHPSSATSIYSVSPLLKARASQRSPSSPLRACFSPDLLPTCPPSPSPKVRYPRSPNLQFRSPAFDSASQLSPSSDGRGKLFMDTVSPKTTAEYASFTRNDEPSSTPTTPRKSAYPSPVILKDDSMLDGYLEAKGLNEGPTPRLTKTRSYLAMADAYRKAHSQEDDADEGVDTFDKSHHGTAMALPSPPRSPVNRFGRYLDTLPSLSCRIRSTSESTEKVAGEKDKSQVAVVEVFPSNEKNQSESEWDGYGDILSGCEGGNNSDAGGSVLIQVGNQKRSTTSSSSTSCFSLSNSTSTSPTSCGETALPSLSHFGTGSDHLRSTSSSPLSLAERRSGRSMTLGLGMAFCPAPDLSPESKGADMRRCVSHWSETETESGTVDDEDEASEHLAEPIPV